MSPIVSMTENRISALVAGNLTAMSGSVGIPVTSEGLLSGVAWATAAPGGVDLHAMGKISLVLDVEGSSTQIASQPPGYHRNAAAPEEVRDDVGRLLLVRGFRSTAGRVMLRKGADPLAEAGFGPGGDIVTSPLAGSAKTTMSGKQGEWLVVEGAEHAAARRWCKLPKLGVVATYGANQRMVLRYKILCVDVTSWIVSFIYRATKPLGRSPMPASVHLGAMTVEQVTGGAIRPSIPLNGTVALAGAPAPSPSLPFNRSQPPRLPPYSIIDHVSTGTVDVMDPAEAHAAQAQWAPQLEDTTTNVRDLPAPKGAATGAPAPDPGLRAEVERRYAAGRPLSDLDLRGARLEQIQLANARLFGLDLSRADLRGADLTGADLTGARLCDARLDGARLDGANLSNAIVDNTTFGAASMRSVMADELQGVEASFDEAVLERSRFRRARLVGATLERVRAAGMDLAEADLTGAQLNGGSFERANMRGANLRRAGLRGAHFSGADLSDADLREVSGLNRLPGANLEGAKR